MLSKRFMLVAWAFALASLCGVAQAGEGRFEPYETIDLPGSWTNLHDGSTVSVEIPGGWRHVKKIFVQAEAFGSDGMVEVYANGDHKGTLFVPRRDPPYVVTIGETVHTIEFRHTHGCEVRIFNVKAVLSARPVEGWMGEGRRFGREPGPGRRLGFPAGNVATWIARRSIDIVDRLRDFVDPETEYIVYLLPIKTVAGRAYAVAAAEGDLSLRTREHMGWLAKQITFAEPVISSLMKKDVTFDMAVELVSIKNEIEDRLR